MEREKKLTRTTSLRLTEEMYQAIKEYCYESRITLSEVVRAVAEKIINNK